jgi:hypothetical protein
LLSAQQFERAIGEVGKRLIHRATLMQRAAGALTHVTQARTPHARHLAPRPWRNKSCRLVDMPSHRIDPRARRSGDGGDAGIDRGQARRLAGLYRKPHRFRSNPAAGFIDVFKRRVSILNTLVLRIGWCMMLSCHQGGDHGKARWHLHSGQH